jgi:DNA invertase Pin-like site-specific DNA recombinase
MKGRYIRVSRSNQNTIRQEVKANKEEVLFIDKISGAIPFIERPQAKELMKAVDDNKINYIIVSSIDRLGRNTLDILKTIELLHTKNVTVFVENLGLESLINKKESATFKLIISVLANISEMERMTTLERIREGVAIAKLNGKYTGRVKNTTESQTEFLAKYPKVVQLLKRPTTPSLRDIAKLTDVTVNTVQKVKRML